MSSPDLGLLFHDLVRVETTVWNAVDARLGEQHQLTLARFEVMQVIAASTPCRVLDIAGRLEITWGGASKVVDRIEAAGHGERRPNPADARSSVITLTRRGRSVLRAATGTVETELQAQLGALLDGEELAALAHALRRLRHRADAGP
ncbi:MarR family winged helix-turn-helix transcriptional regulator [Jatrophihabitans sp. YIM 134969]